MLDNDAIATVYKITSEDLAAQSVENADNVDAHLDERRNTSVGPDAACDSVKARERVGPLPTYNLKN